MTPARSRVPALGPRDQNRGHRPRAVNYSAMLSLVFAIVGVVLWIEGGPHPGGLAAAGGDPDRFRAADAPLLAVLLYSCRAPSRYPGPESMSKAARFQPTRVRAAGSRSRYVRARLREAR